MTLRITAVENRIHLEGDLGLHEFRRVLATMHSLRTTLRQGSPQATQGRPVIEIDFGRCTFVAPGAMAAIAVGAQKLRNEGILTLIQLPSDWRLRNLFLNAGWAHFLDPSRFDASHFRGYTHVPLSQFNDSQGQGALVNHLLDALLKSAATFSREDFAAIEWAMNEITDNVLVHSQSRVGGFVQLNNFVESKQVELVVVDGGVGIPKTLRGAVAAIQSDSDALEHAIREGVTRGTGQGNGLYGSYRIAEGSGGYFSIHSGYSSLEAIQGRLSIHPEPIPFVGTLVISRMDYSQADVLANALEFGGERHTPLDQIETQYETEGPGIIVVDLSEESTFFGSRPAGSPVRAKLLGLYRLASDVRILRISLSGVPLVSSSFADEVFGKLFSDLGEAEFDRVVRIEGANPNVRSLIDRALRQRRRRGA